MIWTIHDHSSPWGVGSMIWTIHDQSSVGCLGWAKLGCLGWLKLGVSAVCSYSKTARNAATYALGIAPSEPVNPLPYCGFVVATLKSIRPVDLVAMTNQTEDDEIAQSATKADKRNRMEIRYAWAKIKAEI